MEHIEEKRNPDGTFKNGHPGFKPKGASNQLQADIRQKLGAFLQGKLDDIESIYENIPDKEKGRFILEVVSYFLPKQKEILMAANPDDKGSDLSKWSDSDLHALIELHDKYQSHEN